MEIMDSTYMEARMVTYFPMTGFAASQLPEVAHSPITVSTFWRNSEGMAETMAEKRMQTQVRGARRG